jgi:hypothetical protein
MATPAKTEIDVHGMRKQEVLRRLREAIQSNTFEDHVTLYMYDFGVSLDAGANERRKAVATFVSDTVTAAGFKAKINSTESNSDCSVSVETPFKTVPPASEEVKQAKDWRDFAVGDIIDARDTVNRWYESTVLYVNPDRVCIHFNGWSNVRGDCCDLVNSCDAAFGTDGVVALHAQKYDEWISRDSDRLAARGAKSTGPFRPHTKKEEQAKDDIGARRVTISTTIKYSDGDVRFLE